jgi:hypothetical protein
MPSRLFATQLLAAIEDDEGIEEELTGSDAILVSKVDFKPAIENYEREVLWGTLSRKPGIVGKYSAQISCTVELRGHATPGTAPDYGILLEACGFAVTPTPEVTPTTVVITPITDDIPSLTMCAIYDGVAHTIIGARGNVKLTCEAGKPGILDFVFTGVGLDVEDKDLQEANYDDVIPPKFLDANFEVDEYAAIINKLDFDMGNEVALRTSINAESGFLSALITGRNPKGSIDPELPLVAAYDFYSKLKSDATGALTLQAIDAEGNYVLITAPVVKYANITPGDRNGIRELGVDLEFRGDDGDDEISITLGQSLS